MNIFYTVDNGFVPQLATGIVSVCENNRWASSITFYVGSAGVLNANKQKLEELVASYGRELRFVDLGNLKEAIGFDFDTLGWGEVVLGRILVESLLPATVDRVLYLDGDTIVIDSLEDLWNQDLGDCWLGASMEPTVTHARKVSLGLENSHYFNSGVLLIDLHKWRENHVGERILKYYADRDGRLFAPDQDAINGACAGKIYPLLPRYNYYNIYWFYPYEMLRKLESPAPYFSKVEYQAAVSKPAIIHFLGEERPWRKGNHHPYRAYYQRYLAMTPWKNTPQEEGWEFYLGCFKAFYTVLKPFPMLRYRIIDSLIPSFMRFRKRQRQK